MIHFEDFITNAPTCCLIEDYWMLHGAMDDLQKGDINAAKETIACVMECIESVIDQHTQAKLGRKITPSIYSVIAMCVDNGIILNDYNDLNCAGGSPISTVVNEAESKCASCKLRGTLCNPDDGKFLLEGNIPYCQWGTCCDNSETVSALEAHYDKNRPAQVGCAKEVK